MASYVVDKQKPLYVRDGVCMSGAQFHENVLLGYLPD